MVLSPVNLVLGLLAAGMIASGIQGLVLAPLIAAQVPGVHAGLDWLVAPPAGVWVGLAQFVVLIPTGLLIAPAMLRGHQALARALLAPTAGTLLAQRVQALSARRAQAVDDHAEALRRIERDLHDGAQARLVALSMSLGLASDMLSTDPERARQLVTEAHADSQTALSELRGLVRGIQPPVLAERGLVAAIEAVAFTLPVPVHVTAVVPPGLGVPVETALYFAVTECLTNAVKHAHACGVTVDLRTAADVIRVTVSDDGIGGAAVRNGTGLAGVARRLEALDGSLTVHSPDGGPTVVTVEVPCAS
jgi:signal transduction histidine kinase